MLTTAFAILAGFSGLSILQLGNPGARAEPSPGVGSGARLSSTSDRPVDNCPMHVAGTTVTSTNVDGGVAMVFSTKSGDVIELRRRVEHMVEQHNRHTMTGGRMLGGPGIGKGGRRSGARMLGDGMMMPASTASALEIPFGAHLVFKAVAPSGIESLRAHVRMRVSRMSHGDCPMISASAPAPKPPTPSNESASPNPRPTQ